MPVLAPTRNCSDESFQRQADAELHRQRVRQLRSVEIDFIPHPEFTALASAAEDEAEALLPVENRGVPTEVELPAHLQRMCDSDLLSAEQERTCFREMNLAKYRAHRLQLELALDDDPVDSANLDQCELLLAHARRIRDHLIQANTRLVISIVKKFVTPQQSFDDLLSEGLMILMKAVEKFDFDRGFRFSTYAYRSILRHVYRTVSLARKEEARFTRDAEDWAFAETDPRASSLAAEQSWNNLQELMHSFLDHLDRRERFIIRCRYALGSHRQTRTFQYLANKLGISKERVRQLEARAVAKLRTLAKESGNDDFFASILH